VTKSHIKFIHLVVHFWLTIYNHLVLELTYIKHVEARIAQGEHQDMQMLLQVPFDKVLFGTTLMLQKFKCDPSRPGNDKSYEIMIEVAIVTALNSFIKFYIRCDQLKPAFYYQAALEIAMDWERFSPENPFAPKKSKLIVYDPDFQLVEDLINRDIDRQDKKGLVNMYLAGYFEFTDVIKHPGAIQSTVKYTVYKKNDKKSGYRENPLMNTGPLNLESRVSGYRLKGFLDFYSVPVRMDFDNGKRQIDLIKCFELLMHN